VQWVERGSTVVRDVGLEDYVRATIISEFAPAAGDSETVERMYEVQSIISRTYAASHLGRHARDGFDLCATTHCQLFDPGRLRTSRWASRADAATGKTAGRLLRFQGRAAEALFHADCGGRTSRASAVWGGDDRAYLVSRPDEDLPDATHAPWEYQATASAVTAALAADDRTRFEGSLSAIEIASRDDAGRAELVAIRSRGARSGDGSRRVIVRGEDFRQALSRAFGARSIRSTKFDIRRDGGSYTFRGYGYGHGVGLCQAGALARLRAGARPADVLRFYYPATTVH